MPSVENEYNPELDPNAHIVKAYGPGPDRRHLGETDDHEDTPKLASQQLYETGCDPEHSREIMDRQEDIRARYTARDDRGLDARTEMDKLDSMLDTAQADECVEVEWNEAEAKLRSEVKFRSELSKLINRYSKENGSNTADFILARYLESCLDAFDSAVNYRDKMKGIS